MSKDVVFDELSVCADAESTVSRDGSIYTDSLYKNKDCFVLDPPHKTEPDSAAAAPHNAKETFSKSESPQSPATLSGDLDTLSEPPALPPTVSSPASI